MNTFVKNLFTYSLIAVSALFAVWLLLSHNTTRENYLALARIALLFLGILVIAWGALWLKPNMVALGICLLVAGFLTFFLVGSPDGVSPSAAHYASELGDSLLWRVKCGLRIPLTAGGLCIGHLAVIGFLVANGILIRRSASGRHFLGANIILVAAISLLALIAI